MQMVSYGLTIPILFYHRQTGRYPLGLINEFVLESEWYVPPARYGL